MFPFRPHDKHGCLHSSHLMAYKTSIRVQTNMHLGNTFHLHFLIPGFPVLVFWSFMLVYLVYLITQATWLGQQRVGLSMAGLPWGSSTMVFGNCKFMIILSGSQDPTKIDVLLVLFFFSPVSGLLISAQVQQAPGNFLSPSVEVNGIRRSHPLCMKHTGIPRL